MYRTCLFCHGDLAANEAVEAFPVGRRLAFDQARGRLWVVCRHCERWNLSPLEERWEAIEQCERLFRDTRLRVSTDNVGLARLPGGVELVRIGTPQRPELAAWRYGDQFGRRRRQALVRAGVGLGAVGALVAGGVAAGVGLGAFWWFGQGLVKRAVHGDPDAVVARIAHPDGAIQVRRRHLQRVRVAPGEGGSGWRLTLARKRRITTLEGEAAVRAAGALLPAMNRFGGTRRQVDDAVHLLERSADSDGVFAAAARVRHGRPAPAVHQLPYPVRLALEMAAHEDAERRALHGELALLEQAWREAEEVAAISDTLLLPDSLHRTLERLRAAAGV